MGGKAVSLGYWNNKTEFYDGPTSRTACVRWVIRCDIRIDLIAPLRPTWHPVTGELIRTEDTWFCEQAAKVGIKTYCDPTLGVKHIGDFQY